MVNDALTSGRDALSTFLTTLLGEAHPFSVDGDAVEPARAAGSRLEDGIVLLATDARNAIAIRLDSGFLTVLSQAMLGDALQPGEEGADDLLRELAAQGFGAVRSTLSALGTALPDLAFAPATADEARAALTGDVRVVSAEFTAPTGPLRATALIAMQPEEKRAAPARPAAPMTSGVQVAPAAFPDLGTEAITSGDGAAFGLLAEVELEVTVELGRRRLALADVLRLTTGSVIELEKLVGEPLQVYANNRLIAEGEAVVIDEQFGIRITNLISNARRAKAFI